MAHFHLKDTVLTERRLPLPGRVVVLGRSLDADVPIPHVSVSRRHALVEKTHNGYVISDLGSSNGTFVEGRPVPPGERVPVPLGEAFRVGKVDIRIVPDEVLDGQDVPVSAPAASAGLGELNTEAFPALGPEKAPPKPVAAKAPEPSRPKKPELKKRMAERRARKDAFRWAGIGITAILLLVAGLLVMSIVNRSREESQNPAEGAAEGEKKEEESTELLPLEINED